MADLRFSHTWRAPETPPPPPLTENRPGFLQQGTVLVQQSQEQVRAYSFSTDPAIYTATIEVGERGFYPLNFRLGRVNVRVIRGSNAGLLLGYSQEHQFVSGRVQVVSGGLPAVGALTAFAVWPSALPDPYDYYVEDASNVNSGGVGDPYSYNHVVFVPKRNARYLAVGSKVFGLPSTGFRQQYYKRFMLVKAYPGGTWPDHTYSKAREVQVSIRPDRLNYSTNPNFANNTTSWTNVTRTARGLGFVGEANAVGLTTHVVPSLRIGRTYTVSVAVDDVKTSTLTPSLVSGGVLLGSSGPVSISGTPQRVFLTFEATATTATVGFTGTTDTVSFYEMLVEEGTTARAYFDGSTSGDTVWEIGQTAGSARSYLYTNREERYAAIRRVLDENVPMGIGVAVPKFGVLPPD